MSSFKKEAALLPVVSGTREHQNKRVAQLWRAIRMKDAFFKRLTKIRPRKKPSKLLYFIYVYMFLLLFQKQRKARKNQGLKSPNQLEDGLNLPR